MNISPADSRTGLLYVSFNQDSSQVAVGTQDGFRIYSTDTGACLHRNKGGAVRTVEMLQDTDRVAVVGAGEQPSLSPRRLSVLSLSSGASIADLHFVSSVLAVRTNGRRLVAVLERKAHIHHIDSLELLSTVDTPVNSRGVVALSSSPAPSLLALPVSPTTGAVLIYDTLNLHALCQISAHHSPIAALAFTADGSLLASASRKGTVIRVHHVLRDTKALTFRRGTYPATIHSLAFGPPSPPPTLPPFLCAASDSGSIHIFRVQASDPRASAGNASALVRKVVPGLISDVVDSERCFALVRHPVFSGAQMLCTITSSRRVMDCQLEHASEVLARLLVVARHGVLMDYYMVKSSAGDRLCTLEREFALAESEPEAIAAHFM